MSEKVLNLNASKHLPPFPRRPDTSLDHLGFIFLSVASINFFLSTKAMCGSSLHFISCLKLGRHVALQAGSAVSNFLFYTSNL